MAEPCREVVELPEEQEEDTVSRVGAFRNQVYANNLLRELQEQEYPARIEDSNGFYRVVVGSYPTLQEAAQMEQRLNGQDIQRL